MTMTGFTVPLSDLPALKKLVDTCSTFIFDCDGVIWNGSVSIPGSPETINWLRSQGKRIFFITNNATKSRKSYLKKFSGMGIECNPEDMLTSAYAAASYLKSIGFNKKVYIVGEAGLCEEFKDVGIEYCGGPDFANRKVDFNMECPIVIEDNIGAVVVGFDQDINYYKTSYAIECLRDPEVMFVATNTDRQSPISPKQILAGGGTMVMGIAHGADREPFVAGKPNQFLMQYIMKTYNLKPEEMCMVGDRLDTDIEFGQGGGLHTLLVMSGVTTKDVLCAKIDQTRPGYIVECLASLTPLHSA